MVRRKLYIILSYFGLGITFGGALVSGIIGLVEVVVGMVIMISSIMAYNREANKKRYVCQKCGLETTDKTLAQKHWDETDHFIEQLRDEE